jgi:hypothetical protein
MPRTGFILILLSVFLLRPSAFAQELDYKERLSGIIEETSSLEDLLRSNSVDYPAYDKWYKEFKKLSEGFLKDFSKTDKQRDSFKAAGEGIEALSLAWAGLNQAEYAQEQYKEYITSDRVEDAHRWKSKATDLRKKAAVTIQTAVDNFKSAQDYLNRE